MALYGYARVSTSDQDFTLQEQALRAAGCQVIRAEKVSATRREGRTELALLLEFLRQGDTLVVTRIDRLARSIKDLQDIVHLLKERGVTQVAAVAQVYGVSSTTVYRALRALLKPRAAHRTDRGTPRVLPRAGLERYCELIAALKLRTTNKQGRHLSTQRTIELLEQYGVETPQGLIRAPQGVLHKTTVNVYLRHALIGFRGLSRPTTQ